MAAEDRFCHLILDSARLVATVPSGGKLWGRDGHPTGDLCVILQDGGGSCTSALTPSQPTTIESFKANDQTSRLSVGASPSTTSPPSPSRQVDKK